MYAFMHVSCDGKLHVVALFSYLKFVFCSDCNKMMNSYVVEVFLKLVTDKKMWVTSSWCPQEY